MTATRAAGDGIECGLAVGDRLVDVGFAVPVPGESLSAAARRLAERLVARRAGLPGAAVRVAALLPSGRPVATGPDGILPVSVAMAHERRFVGAAVCDASGVGIDIVDPAAVRAGLDHWLDAAERGCAGSVTPGMLWAAKEAAYKAARLDASFRPLAVSVEPDGDEGFTWRLQDDWRAAHGQGRFLDRGGHLVAVACSAATDEPTADEPTREMNA
jgi:4'-phosphopantetheinyl transferase EntD